MNQITFITEGSYKSVSNYLKLFISSLTSVRSWLWESFLLMSSSMLFKSSLLLSSSAVTCLLSTRNCSSKSPWSPRTAITLKKSVVTLHHQIIRAIAIEWRLTSRLQQVILYKKLILRLRPRRPDARCSEAAPPNWTICRTDPRSGAYGRPGRSRWFYIRYYGQRLKILYIV